MGPFLQKIVIGGPDYGHHTLTRFFALHAGVIPAATAVLIVAHVYLFRRHGLTPKRPLRKADEPFWPEQVLRDAVACLAVLAAVLFLIVKPRLFHDGAVMGAELAAPADPSEAYSAARPEWYFLFLFQFLKYFPGETEIFGAIVIPTLVLFLVALMPILGRWRLGHRFNLFFLGVLLIGAARLTYEALAEDKHNPSYQLAIEEAHKNSERVKELAASGIPRDGALSLLQNDAYTQGPKIFAKNCAGCHRYEGHDGLGGQPKDAPTASDLKDFGSRQWLTGLLDPAHVASTNYFGATKLDDGKMVKFVKKTVADFTPEQKGQLSTALAALSAEAALPYQAEVEIAAVAEIEKGRALIRSEAMRCTECHQFHKADEDATAPDLTGYASRDWLVAFVSNPADARFYGKRNDRMPAFGKDGKLDQRSIEMVVDWLRRDWAKAHPSVATN
jgi:ubiquinol-cytochrome c reductase cytochrome b subunit